MEQQIIDLPPFPDIDDIPIIEDTTILETSTLEINTNLNPSAWQLQWSPEHIMECSDCTIGRITSRESTTVTLQLEHITGCIYETSFFLTVNRAPENIYAPNVFTPNSNALNKTWTISTTSNVTIEECNIYDRWGKLMYQSQQELPSWDGMLPC